MAVVPTEAAAQPEVDQIEIPTGAVFVVQIEEQPHCKALRRVEDSVFLCRDQFMVSASIYADMVSGQEGVNRYLRAMLFAPSRQLRRGVRRSELGNASTTAASSGKEGSSTALKQAQRKSKQKERCENRLMSLLFATIYDPATRRCSLVQGVPALKLRRLDKNGKYRNVSNYTDVRMFLRNLMSSILSSHTEATKVLVSMLPRVYSSLPTMFMLIARTFMFILSCTSASAKASWSEAVDTATESLETCFSAIRDYILTWEKRNFTTDNPLGSSVIASKDDECYQSIRTLLEAMIRLVPPNGGEPFGEDFQDRELYSFGLQTGTKCGDPGNSEEHCILGSNCPKSYVKPTNENLLTEAHTYVDALVGCAKTSIGMEREALNGELAEIDFDPLWFRSASDVILLHRQKAMHEWVHSTISPRNGEKTGEEFKETIAENFVQSARFDVAEFWAAVGRSNSRALTIMETLEITERKIFIDTAVELVFGGGIAAITLFEREKEIIPICANLRGKTGLSMLKMNDGTDMTETFIPENTDTNVISPTPQGRPEQDVPTTPREEELGATAVVEKAISEDDRAKMRANASGNAENSSQPDTVTPNAKKILDPSTAATLETTPQSQEVEPIEAQKRMGAESGDEQESVLQSGQGTAEPNDEQDDSPQSRQGTAETVEPASPIVVNERSKPAVSVAKKPQRAPKRKKRKGSMTQTVEAARASTQISPKPRKRTRKKK